MNNTLLKGLKLLELLVARDRGAGVSELAEALGIARSNVHRILQALVETGYVVNEDGRGRYRASLRVWELGARVLQRQDVREPASSAMHWLLARSNETVHLSVLSGSDVVYIDKLDSPEPVRAYTEIGGRAPAYCVATGKVLLAWQEPQAAPQLATRKLPRFTPSTVADSVALARELERVRRQGYAVNRGEWRASVWGIAAPLRDGAGKVVAAIGISGPATRIRDSGLKALSQLVVEAAGSASQALARSRGAQPSSDG